LEPIEKLHRLTTSHGALKPGKGMVTGVIALGLAILCFLGVLAFHFPEYLTTPELRKSYNVDVMRLLLFWSLVLSGALALFNVIRSRARWLALGAFTLIGLSLALGGHKVPVNDFADNTPYIGLDWFILDLLGSTLIFVFIEKAFALRKDQPVLDLAHGLARRKAGAIGDAEDVRVDRDGGLSEGRVQHHVGGLAADAGQGLERFAVPRHPAAMLLEQELRHRDDVGGLRVEQADAADVLA